MFVEFDGLATSYISHQGGADDGISSSTDVEGENDDEEDKSEFVIDTSTPETLERDFYAWLKGELKTSFSSNKQPDASEERANPSFANTSNSTVTLPPIEYFDKSNHPLLTTTKCATAQNFRKQREEELPELLLSDGQSPGSSSSCSSASPSQSNSSLGCMSSVWGKNSENFVIGHPPASYQGGLVKPKIMGESSLWLVVGEDVSQQNKTSNVEVKEQPGEDIFPGFLALRKMPKSEDGERPHEAENECKKNLGDESNEQSFMPNNRSSGINQLGRMYSPGLPLSMSERELIVDFYRNGRRICDISKKLCVTHSCVSKILHRFRTTGSVRPKDAKEGRQESPLVAAIRDYRHRLGMTRQSEIREQLILDGICTRENAPSRSSINHILRTKLDLKRRKKHS
ncbi:Paired box domain-containing protein [Ditylenchus destructor]|uniref:Paired box domain-containing protein n=1 Tax=Ditylenchus destructor TaxID=166010 RepID=A0AAD4N0T6_9BILA|nr:Paired box domain-containing protein [Ditylenchus destructor]